MHNVLPGYMIIVSLFSNILLVYNSTNSFHQIFIKIILPISFFWTNNKILATIAKIVLVHLSISLILSIYLSHLPLYSIYLFTYQTYSSYLFLLFLLDIWLIYCMFLPVNYNIYLILTIAKLGFVLSFYFLFNTYDNIVVGL